MKWYDGTNVQYSNWLSGRPTVNQTFMAGLAVNGKWFLTSDNNSFSDFKQMAIVACKLDNGGRGFTRGCRLDWCLFSTKRCQTPSCPESKEEYNKTTTDYQMYNNLTYKVLTESLTWYQALQECGLLGGHLASVHDLDHISHIADIVKTDGFPLWVGLSKQDVSSCSIH